MIFIKPLNAVEIITLQCMSKNHPLLWTRTRANSILLSNQGISSQVIANIHSLCRQTISIWINNWETKGICGLIDKKGRGRRRILSITEEIEVIDIIKKTPRSLKQALVEIKKCWGIKLSIKTLKRLCKKSGLSWKRVRKSLRGKRDDEQFYIALKEIKELVKQVDSGDEDLYYFDESGFTLEPSVPYAWQNIGQQIEIPSSKSARLNVLGFIDRNCNFESYVFEGTITTECVIACFNEFAKKITKKTTVIIDNASIHTSNKFKENIELWKSNNLIIKNIPAYSPELNKIEILWRKIKYEWLDFDAYKSFSDLKESLNYILANIGKKYYISFT